MGIGGRRGKGGERETHPLPLLKINSRPIRVLVCKNNFLTMSFIHPFVHTCPVAEARLHSFIQPSRCIPAVIVGSTCALHIGPALEVGRIPQVGEVVSTGRNMICAEGHDLHVEGLLVTELALQWRHRLGEDVVESGADARGDQRLLDELHLTGSCEGQEGRRQGS